MKLLVWLEIVRLSFVLVLSIMILTIILTTNYFLLSLIFLVCESSLGFMLFILYKLEYVCLNNSITNYFNLNYDQKQKNKDEMKQPNRPTIKQKHRGARENRITELEE